MENSDKNIEEQRKWDLDSMWENDGHEWSKSFKNTENLWNTEIFGTIKMFRDKKILEIGCGRGRFTQFLSILASDLIVTDLNSSCIKITKEKLKHWVLAYFVGDGKTLTGIKDNSQDLIFSFDSFVHMHKDVIESYIKEIHRVLKHNGCAFIHHSNFFGGSDLSFENIAGRSNMNPALFKKFVENNNMEILYQRPIYFQPISAWSGEDTISFFRKDVDGTENISTIS